MAAILRGIVPLVEVTAEKRAPNTAGDSSERIAANRIADKGTANAAGNRTRRAPRAVTVLIIYATVTSITMPGIRCGRYRYCGDNRCHGAEREEDFTHLKTPNKDLLKHWWGEVARKLCRFAEPMC
ncbi:hypothetical protein [Sphingomonas immobilis]|uniref:hypothetical protein n=1 Tax=Sphingomonas immobilis TaxID=3063997 RepID=UPI003D66F7CB